MAWAKAYGALSLPSPCTVVLLVSAFWGYLFLFSVPAGTGLLPQHGGHASGCQATQRDDRPRAQEGEALLGHSHVFCPCVQKVKKGCPVWVPELMPSGLRLVSSVGCGLAESKPCTSSCSVVTNSVPPEPLSTWKLLVPAFPLHQDILHLLALGCKSLQRTFGAQNGTL